MFEDNFESFKQEFNKIGSIDVVSIMFFVNPFDNVSVIVLFIVSFNDECSFLLIVFLLFSSVFWVFFVIFFFGIFFRIFFNLFELNCDKK